jgi:hypothetical protein
MVAPSRDAALPDELEPPSPLDRARDLALAPLRVVGALLLPDRYAPRAVALGRYAAPLLAVILAALATAWAIGSRLDPTQMIAAQANAVAGTEGAMSDRDVAEAIAKVRRIGQVKLGLGAGLGTPFRVLLLGVGLFLVARYVGGKPTIGRCVTAASLGALPGAVKALVTGVAALRSAVISPMESERLLELGTLAAPGTPLHRLLSLRPFDLWAVVILGFALAEAAGLRRRKAFATVIAAYVLFRLFLVITGGPPPQPPSHPGAP